MRREHCSLLLHAAGHNLRRFFWWLRLRANRSFDINDKIAHLGVVDALDEFELAAVVLPADGLAVGSGFAFRADHPGDSSGDGGRREEQAERQYRKQRTRSEERRVGKECRSRWSP